MRSIKIIILFLFTTLSNYAISQRVDFNKLKTDIVQAQEKKEKVEAIIAFSNALSPKQSDLIEQYADSVLLLSESKDSTYFINSSNFLRGLALYRKGKLKSALPIFKRCENYFSAVKSKNTYKCTNLIGIIYNRLNLPDSSIIVYENALLSIEELKPKVSIHGNLGKSYRKVGNYAKAIEHLETAVNLDPSNLFSTVNSYLVIASMYKDMELYEKGIHVLQKINGDQLPNSPIKIAYHNNYGELLYLINDYDSSEFYLSKGVALSDKLKIYQLGINNRITISDISLKNKDTNQSFLLLQKAKELAYTHYNRPEILIGLNFAFIKYFQFLNQYDSVIQYGNKIISITESTKLSHLKKDVYNQIADAYEKTGNINKSNEFLKLHAQFQNTLEESSKLKFLTNAKARYLVALKEKELSLEKDESSVFKKNSLVISLVAALIIALVLYIITNKLKKSKKELKATKHENILITEEVKRNQKEVLELKSKAILPLEELVSIESDGHYLEFYLSNKDKPEIDRNRLKEIKENLPSNFIQIHKSFIINTTFIKVKYADKVVMKDGRELSVSRTYKEELNKIIKN